MGQLIEVPGHGVVEFPDGMTDEQISAAIKKNMMVPKAEKPTRMETLKDAVLNSRHAPLMGGPMGMLTGESIKKVGELTDKAAYNVGGATTDVLAGKVSPEAAGLAGYLANIGTQLGASYLFGKAGAAVGKPTMERAAERTMGAAIKPLKADWESGDAAKAIKTLLKEDISPNQAGMRKLQEEINKLEGEIDLAIKNSPAMINKAKVGQRLRDALNTFRMQVNPQSDTEAIRKAWDQFKNHPELVGKTEMPVQTAQAMKRATDKALGGKVYGELKGAEVEAQKALRRGLKEEIAAAVPEVAPRNQRASELLNALEIGERRALMENNKNILGLAPIAPNTGSMLAFLADRSPAAMAQLARLMYRNSGVLPGGAASAVSMPLLMGSGTIEPSPLLQYLRGYLPQE